MHHLLILSNRAEDYARLVQGANVPGLTVHAAADIADVAALPPVWTIVLGEPVPVSNALPHLPALVWVQLTWAGAERLLTQSTRRDFILTNVRGVFGPLMSEYVFTYLLAHERRVVERLEAQREGRWDATPPASLRGKVLGLVGVGSIGAHVATTAKHFGMRVRGYTRGTDTSPHVDQYFHGDQKASFAHGLDYLVALLPDAPATRGLIDRTMLGALPRHALFVNAGRAVTVDEDALVEALTARRIAGAVLDVFREEPLPADHVLWRTPGVIITSHTAALSHPPDISQVFVDNYRRFVRGEPLLHQVEFERGY